MNKDSQINKIANNIVDKNYKNKKVKPVFTQMADNARDLLGYKYNPTTGDIRNNDNDVLPAKEAVKINDALEQNFKQHKQDDYFAKLKRLGIEESKIKHPDYPKVSNQPILRNNVNTKSFPNKNPTVSKYKAFKDNQKRELEEKRFNENFEKQYGDKAIGQHIRKKEYANKKAGRAPYQDFSSSDIIVAEDLKEKAANKLKAMNLPKSTDSISDLNIIGSYEPMVPFKKDLAAIQAEENFKKLQREIKEEKFRLANSGLASIMGGDPKYDK